MKFRVARGPPMERCPLCGRRIILFQRRNRGYAIASCVCGLYETAPEKDELKEKLRRIRRQRRR